MVPSKAVKARRRLKRTVNVRVAIMLGSEMGAGEIPVFVLRQGIPRCTSADREQEMSEIRGAIGRRGSTLY